MPRRVLYVVLICVSLAGCVYSSLKLFRWYEADCELRAEVQKFRAAQNDAGVWAFEDLRNQTRMQMAINGVCALLCVGVIVFGTRRLTVVEPGVTIEAVDNREQPVAWRANAEDRERLEYLKERTGLGVAGVMRLALKRLFDMEKKLDK